jgi:hypothetical protein
VRALIVAAISILLAGCTTATHIYDDRGDPIVMVQCGSGLSFSICYDRAAKECPNGYRTVSEEPGFNRKTLKVECKR